MAYIVGRNGNKGQTEGAESPISPDRAGRPGADVDTRPPREACVGGVASGAAVDSVGESASGTTIDYERFAAVVSEGDGVAPGPLGIFAGEVGGQDDRDRNARDRDEATQQDAARQAYESAVAACLALDRVEALACEAAVSDRDDPPGLARDVKALRKAAIRAIVDRGERVAVGPGWSVPGVAVGDVAYVVAERVVPGEPKGIWPGKAEVVRLRMVAGFEAGQGSTSG